LKLDGIGKEHDDGLGRETVRDGDDEDGEDEDAGLFSSALLFGSSSSYALSLTTR